MFDELYNTVKMRYGVGSASQPMSSWLTSNTTYKRRPFSFDGYEFQRQIADDMHPDLNVIKCSQVGLTEIQFRKFLAILTRNKATSGIFTLPTEKMFSNVSKTRLKPLLDQDDIFNPTTETKPVRSTGLIQIGDSFGYITGCTEGDATSTPADFLMHDELDLSPEDMIALYQSRLQNSDMKITQKFSTPTFVGYGIDKSYSLSDQREYLAKCPACNHWQIPRFTPPFIHCPDFEKIEVANFTDLTAEQVAIMDLSEVHVRCEKCQRRLPLSEPMLREWVATYPGRTTFRGYRVRPFSAGRLSAQYVFTQLAKYLDQGFIRGFFNTVMGEPYNEASAQIQRADIEACMRGGEIPHISADTPIYLGVDVGFQCWITLSYDTPEGLPCFVLFENVPYAHLETRIGELRRIYNIVQGAIDRFPFTPLADALRQNTNGLIMPIQYRGTAGLQPIKDELGILTHYSANQTLIFDLIHSLISHRRMVIGGYTHLRETLIAHLGDMVRDERPDAEATWKKIGGNDHLFHSMAINMLARRICEHMYHNRSGVAGNTTLLTTAAIPGGNGSLLGSASRCSRLG